MLRKLVQCHMALPPKRAIDCALIQSHLSKYAKGKAQGAAHTAKIRLFSGLATQESHPGVGTDFLVWESFLGDANVHPELRNIIWVIIGIVKVGSEVDRGGMEPPACYPPHTHPCNRLGLGGASHSSSQIQLLILLIILVLSYMCLFEIIR